MNNNEVRNSPGDDHDAMICQKSVFASPLLIPDPIITGAIAIWGLVDTTRLAARAPLVGVFIARISKGRTIREFIVGVVLGLTLFSILWFGIYGGAGLYQVLQTGSSIMDVITDNVSGVPFFVLQDYPLPSVIISLVEVAAFLFIVTSVVSAVFVLRMFPAAGDLNPRIYHPVWNTN